MFLLKSLVYCENKQQHLESIRRALDDSIRHMKQEFGTQMMSYPNMYCSLKGERYSVTFPVDKRRGTLNAITQQLSDGFPNTRLKNKENNRVGDVECIRYDFDEDGKEFTITLVGPANKYFYTFEYTKKEEFKNDIQRIMDIYKKANKPPDLPSRRQISPNMPMAQGRAEGDPIENLQALGARVFIGKQGQLDWDYLAGYEEAKLEIEDTILLTLERPDIFDKITEVTRVNNEKNRPKAVLFEGPPGTGKTTSAKIIAHQVKIPMVYVRLETIVSMYYGEAEKNLGKIFQNCSQLGKCLIFIDEIDSLAQSREKDMHEATRRMLSVFLRYLDGVESSEDVVVICATNRKEDLDPALQNRFSKVIKFPCPDRFSREAIFKRYAKHLSDRQLSQLAEESDGLSGRDIRSVCEDSERQWAAKILRGEISEYTVDFQHYLKALRSRISQYR